MNQENTKTLFEKYPKIFVDKDLPSTKSCMAFGFECGDGWYAILDTLCQSIQGYVDYREYVPSNIVFFKLTRFWNQTVWKFLLSPLNEFLFRNKQFGCNFTVWKYLNMLHLFPKYKRSDRQKPQVVATQVKEKFGTLRFYYDGGDDVIRGLVGMAERLSGKTCEHCGATDDSVKRGGKSWISVRCSKCRGE